MEQQARGVTEHIERVLALVAPLPVLSLGVEDALGAVVAEDLYATVSVPPFAGAAMDGYAVRLADLPADGTPVTLRVAGDVAAGPGDPDRLGPGQAVRIMTGAPLPPGADAVVPVEHTSTGRFVAGAPRAEESVTLARRPRPHVRAAGEDVQEGELLARAGTEVTAALVGALAASGTVRVPVRRRPVVAVISTGAELVPVGGSLGPGQITDSNGPMLAAAACAAGADVVRLGPVPDDPGALQEALDAAVRGAVLPDAAGALRNKAADALRNDAAVRGAVPHDAWSSGAAAGDAPCPGRDRHDGVGVDLVVTAGGVSAGSADVVREVLAAPSGGGVTDVDVAAVAMSPGRPQALARWRGVPWLALPGNPVGAYASFELFARPAIDRLRGLGPTGTGLGAHRSLRAAAPWSSPAGRLQVVPVRVTDGGVGPTGSHHSLSALATADGLALVPPDVEKVRAGDAVRVLMLR